MALFVILQYKLRLNLEVYSEIIFWTFLESDDFSGETLLKSPISIKVDNCLDIVD
jgi:hypothetical protein